MKFIYPACFYSNEGGYTVEVPDLMGCVTEGRSLLEAIDIAVETASGWVLKSLEDGEKLPCATEYSGVELKYNNGFVNYIVLDMDRYAEKYGNKPVIKEVFIPAWLNSIAEKEKIDLNVIMQEALRERLMLK